MKTWQLVKDGFVYLYETGLEVRPELFVRWDGEDESLGVGETNNDAMYCPLPPNIRLCRLVDAPAMPAEVAQTIRDALRFHYNFLLADNPNTFVAEWRQTEFDHINAALAWLDQQEGRNG